MVRFIEAVEYKPANLQRTKPIIQISTVGFPGPGVFPRSGRRLVERTIHRDEIHVSFARTFVKFCRSPVLRVVKLLRCGVNAEQWSPTRYEYKDSFALHCLRCR